MSIQSLKSCMNSFESPDQVKNIAALFWFVLISLTTQILLQFTAVITFHSFSVIENHFHCIEYRRNDEIEPYQEGCNLADHYLFINFPS